MKKITLLFDNSAQTAILIYYRIFRDHHYNDTNQCIENQPGNVIATSGNA